MRGHFGKEIAKKIGTPLVAILAGLVVASLCIALMGINPLEAASTFLKSFSGDFYGVCEIVVKALPLLFTGISYAFAQRCGIVNLGAEGQLLMGGLFGTFVGVNASWLPGPLHLLATVLAGFLGGALWGLLAGWLRTAFGILEVISTIMLNWIALFFVSFMVTGPMKEEGFLPQSAELAKGAVLPNIIPGTRLHAGIFVGLTAVLLFYIIIYRTTAGYRIRVVGDNPGAALYAGIHVKHNTLLTMFIAGGFAGLGGSSEIQGVLYRLYENFSPGWGWDGISVALLGQSNPIGVLLSALLLGFIRSGVNGMQRAIGVPIGIVYVVQAVIIICVLVRDFRPAWLKKLRKREVTSLGK